MPEYSSTTITPSDGVQVPGMNGSTSGNFLLSALKSYILSEKGLANGLASLDGNGKLLSSQLPDLADDVIVVDSYATLPATGTAGKIYITADNNKMYRWDPDLETPNYVDLSIDLTEYARIEDIQDGNIQAGVAVKAFQDAMGRAIITTYETKADASDLKDAIDKNSNRISNLEQEHGGYVTVNYRGTDDVPTGKAKYGLAESIVGKSRAWNQLLDKSNYGASKTENNVTFTNNGDGSITVQTTSAGASANTVFRLATSNGDSFQMLANHKYLIAGCPSGGSDSTFMLYENYYGKKDTGGGMVFSENANRGLVILVRVISGAVITTPITFKPIARDLSTILTDWSASDITTANIPNMVEQIPDLLKYDSYGYSLVDTVVEGVKSRGVNWWNEETEMGTISNGSDADSSNSIRTKGYTEVDGRYQYYLNFGKWNNIFCYDENKTYIGIATYVASGSGYTLTLVDGTKYVRWAFTPNYGTTYNNDVQLALNSSSAKETYHPYVEPSSLTLPSPVTLRSAGSVAEVYDLKTGEKTNLIGTIIYGGSSDEHWVLQSINDYGIANFTIVFPQDVVAEINHSICDRFVPQTDPIYDTTTEGFLQAASKNLYIRIQATKANSVSAFKAWLANNPITMYYELATPLDPTQLTPVIDNTIQTEGGGTINTIQTQTTVIDNCLDVGYLAL